MEPQIIIKLLVAGIIISKTLIFILAYLLFKKNRTLKAEKVKLQAANSELSKKALDIELYLSELQKVENFKTKVLSIASHDLRAPFASVELLLKMEGLSSMDRTELEMIFATLRREVVKSRVFLDDILLWTESQFRSTVEHKEIFNLNCEVDNLLEQFSFDLSRSGKHVINKIDKQSRVHISKAVFSVVVRNILSNAIKFGRDNGGIFLHEIASKNGECGVVVVSEGEELSDELLNELNFVNNWEHKKRVSQNGAGLGISLCKDLIKRVGGKIHFENKSGIGVSVSAIFLNNSCVASLGAGSRSTPSFKG